MSDIQWSDDYLPQCVNCGQTIYDDNVHYSPLFDEWAHLDSEACDE